MIAEEDARQIWRARKGARTFHPGLSLVEDRIEVNAEAPLASLVYTRRGEFRLDREGGEERAEAPHASVYSLSLPRESFFQTKHYHFVHETPLDAVSVKTPDGLVVPDPSSVANAFLYSSNASPKISTNGPFAAGLAPTPGIGKRHETATLLRMGERICSRAPLGSRAVSRCSQGAVLDGRDVIIYQRQFLADGGGAGAAQGDRVHLRAIS